MTRKSAGKIGLTTRVFANLNGLISMGIIFTIILFGIIVPEISPWDPSAPDLYSTLSPPSSVHWFGTDSAGRDVFTRLAYATRFSLATATLAVIVALVFGAISGLVAGYYGGWFDSLSTWAISIIMALPGLVVLLAVIAVVGPSMWIAMTVFGVLLAPAYYQLVYITVRGVRNELYVDAARVSGLGDFRIISRHILGVVRAPIIIQTSIVAIIAISIQAGIEFLGLGDRSAPSWGAMVNDAFVQIYQTPTLVIWPSTVIALFSISLVVFGNTVRDELEKTSSSLRGSPAKSSQLVDEVAAPAITHIDEQRTSRAPVLQISNLAVGYSDSQGGIKKVVNDVNLTVYEGEVVGLVGESGSGKTQTAFAVLGLLPSGGKVVAGSIIFEGKELIGASEKDLNKLRGGRISYIPQEPMSNLDASFTIGSQLVEPMMKVMGLSKKAATQRAIELLTRVGIPNPMVTMKRYPHEISGGQAQRVLIAGAVSCNPVLIIADEPTTALDVTVQAEVLDLLRELQQETKTSLLLVTHNFGVVADLCDYINVMQEGRLVESGPVVEIFKNAKHPYTNSLLSAILDGGPARPSYIQPAEGK